MKSVHWLTILGKDIVERPGGHETLTTALGPHCQTYSCNGGITIRAGDQLRFRYVTQGIVLDDYRRVAEALKSDRLESCRRRLFAARSTPEAMKHT
ncbi:DUF3396 domain-containing protein [Neorhizobium sp. P12A]|nr:DUF3396 domain-containing protein [Neorhizobium sp. P12A]